MAENTQTSGAPAEPQPEAEPTRLQNFVAKHPRATKIVAITGAVSSVVGVVCVAKTVKSNKAHLELAGENAKEVLHELSATVDPATSDPEA